MALALKSNGLRGAALAYLPSAVVPAAAALVGTALFARGFGPGDFGRYAVAGGVAVLGAAAGAGWLQQAATRFLPASDAPEDRAAFELGWRILVLATLFGGLALAAAAYPLVGAAWRPLLVPTALLTAATAAYNARLAPFQARADARLFSRYRVLGALIQTVLGLAAMRAGVGPAVAAQALALAILLPSMGRLSEDGPALRRRVGLLTTEAKKGDRPLRGPQPSEAAGTLRKFWRYGAPLGAWAATSSLLAVGERYVLVAACGEAEGGRYAANAGPVVMGVTLAAMPFLTTIHPRLMRVWDADDREGAAKTLAAATEALLYAGLALAALTTLAAPLLAALLGSRFGFEAGTLGAVALGAALGQASMLLHKPLEFAGRTGTMLLFGIAAALSKIGAMAFLAPRFGDAAAPWTTVGAYLGYGALCVRASRPILRSRVRWPGVALATAVCGAQCAFPSPLVAGLLAVVFAAVSFHALRKIA